MKIFKILLPLLLIVVFSNCNTSKKDINKYQNEITLLKSQLDSIAQKNSIIAKNIKKFDELDFVIYSNQEWKRLHESHGENILVHYPDGHTTIGIEAHIKELDPMFVFAPDTRIEEHPIKIGFRKYNCSHRCVIRNLYKTHANRKW